MQEYLDSFNRAFNKRGADYIIIDGWSGKYRKNVVAWGLEKEIIYHDPDIRGDEQYTVLGYRLTDKGRVLVDAAGQT